MEDKLQNRNMIVAGHTLPVSILLDEERFYNDAAKLLNKKVKDYEKEYSKKTPDRIFAMAAYDLVVCLLKYCDPLATEFTQNTCSFNELTEENL